MSIKKKRYSAVTTLLLVLAIGLLLFSTIGSTLAVLNIQSSVIKQDIRYYKIGVSAALGEKAVLTGGVNTVVPGKKYNQNVTITNTGTIDEYVRVTVYKYWENGEDLDPAMIQFKISGWKIDDKLSTADSTVYYSTTPLKIGESTEMKGILTIDGEVVNQATQRVENGIIYTDYKYNGAIFCVEIRVDGVQNHNASDAMKSAWGKSYL